MLLDVFDTLERGNKVWCCRHIIFDELFQNSVLHTHKSVHLSTVHLRVHTFLLFLIMPFPRRRL